jgi:hypothetical protein
VDDIIHQIEVYVKDLKAAKEHNDLDGFYIALKELTNYAFDAEVPE